MNAPKRNSSDAKSNQNQNPDFRVVIGLLLISFLTASGIYLFEWFKWSEQEGSFAIGGQSSDEYGRDLASQKKRRQSQARSTKPPTDPIAEVVPPEVDYTPWYRRRGLGENGKFLATTSISQMISPMPYEFVAKNSWCECRAKGITQPHSGEDFNWTDKSNGPETSIAPSNGVIVRITVDRSCGYALYFYDSYGALWNFFHLNRPGRFEGNEFIPWKEGDPVFQGETFGVHRDFPKQRPKACGWGSHLHLERRSPFQRIRKLAKEREGKLQGGACSTGRSRCYYDPKTVFTEGLAFKVDGATRRNFKVELRNVRLGPGKVVSSREELAQIIENAKNGGGVKDPYPYRLPLDFSTFHFAGYDQPGCDLYQMTEVLKDSKELEDAVGNIGKNFSIMETKPFLLGRRRGSTSNGLGPQKIELDLYVSGKKISNTCGAGQACPTLLKVYAKRKTGVWERVYENNNIRGLFPPAYNFSIGNLGANLGANLGQSLGASTPGLSISENSRVCIPSDTETLIASLVLSNGVKVYGKIEQAVLASDGGKK